MGALQEDLKGARDEVGDRVGFQSCGPSRGTCGLAFSRAWWWFGGDGQRSSVPLGGRPAYGCDSSSCAVSEALLPPEGNFLIPLRGAWSWAPCCA